MKTDIHVQKETNQHDLAPPYVVIFGIKNGETKARKFICPIVWNEYDERYEFSGSENIRIIEMKPNWPTMSTDLIKQKKIAIEKEKEQIRQQKEEYLEIQRMNNYNDFKKGR